METGSLITYRYTTEWNIFKDRDKHNIYALTGAARHAGHNTLDIHGDLPQKTTKEQHSALAVLYWRDSASAVRLCGGVYIRGLCAPGSGISAAGMTQTRKRP